MEFKSRRLADVVVAAPAGRIDHASADGFRDQLAPILEQCAEGRDRIALDFSAVEYISSVGLRVLMVAAKQAKAQGGKIVIAGMQPVVKEIFDISRFSFVFAAFPALRDAIEHLSPLALAALDAK